MDKWEIAFRVGFAPELPLEGLIALREALKNNSVGLQQGTTTDSSCGSDNVRFACAIAYCGWKGYGLKTTQEVREFFSRMGTQASINLSEQNPPVPYVSFIDWFDKVERDEMRKQLLPIVEDIIEQRTEEAEAILTTR